MWFFGFFFVCNVASILFYGIWMKNIKVIVARGYGSVGVEFYCILQPTENSAQITQNAATFQYQTDKQQ